METYIVYVASGEVLGAGEAEDAQQAAEAVVNGINWPDDTAAADVNVARVTDPDYDVPDEVNVGDPALDIEETDLRVAVHN